MLFLARCDGRKSEVSPLPFEEGPFTLTKSLVSKFVGHRPSQPISGGDEHFQFVPDEEKLFSRRDRHLNNSSMKFLVMTV